MLMKVGLEIMTLPQISAMYIALQSARSSYCLGGSDNVVYWKQDCCIVRLIYIFGQLCSI